MAGVISKIRDRAWLVVVVIGISMVAFLATSAYQDFSNLIGRDTSVGEVAGKEIEYQAFNNRFQAQVSQVQARGGSVDDQTRQQILEQLWEQAIGEEMLGQEYAALGLEVSDAELRKLFYSENPSSLLLQIPDLRDPATGRYSPQRMQQIYSSAAGNEQLAEQLKQLEQQVANQRLQEKYFKLIQAANFVSTEEARRNMAEGQRSMSIQFLAINYGSVPDTAVKVSESDYLAYYEEHKNRYKLDKPETIIKYVLFNKEPSAQDSAKLQREVGLLATEFAQQKDDSTYAAYKSEVSQPTLYQPVAALDAALQAWVDKAKVGEVKPPVLEGNQYKLVKLSDLKTDNKSHYKIKHILLRPKGNGYGDTLRARALADSLRRVAKADNFAQLVTQFSDDNQTRFSSGDLGWYARGSFGDQFDTALQGARKDQVVGPVPSQAGFHVVQILDETRRVVRLATIVKELSPSTATLNEMRRKGLKLAGDIDNAANFDTIAAKSGYDVRTSQPLTPGQTFLMGLQGTGELVRWAMTEEVGTLSNLKELDNAFVVGYISSRSSGEYQSLAAVKDQMRFQVTNRKKAAYILDKLKTASGDLEQLRAAYGGSAFVTKAENLTFAATTIPGIGNDPIVLGRAFALKANETSKPIVGNTGVYVIKATAVNEPAAPEPTVVENHKQTLLNNQKNAMSGRLYQGLRDAAAIKDHRYKWGF